MLSDRIVYCFAFVSDGIGDLRGWSGVDLVQSEL
jgi:hypothetical protein